MIDESTSQVFITTLMVQELTGRETAKAFRNAMKTSLKTFNLEGRQIYSITTDNGSNVTKIAEMIEAEAFSSGSDDEENNQNDAWSRALESVTGVRCAMQTLQLAVEAAVDAVVDKSLLQKLRLVIRNVKTVNVRYILVDKNVSLPKLDIVTRWGPQPLTCH
ncbi:hypothetical protein AeMF1_017158 [Aphanomyces euteiches]|nr:hypothetical protein AeMF1_017158 [Aphanomyces euteiches]KAH9182676.1 hypothetical protein AeNC1_015348 [Aphanomyces euteiches]